MKWQSFENKVKVALSGHHTDVDADAIWAAIEPEVDAINRRRKRRGIFWFVLAGLLVAGVAAGNLINSQNEKQHEPLAQTPVANLAKESSKRDVVEDDKASTESGTLESISDSKDGIHSQVTSHRILNKKSPQRAKDSILGHNENDNITGLISDQKTTSPTTANKSEILVTKENRQEPNQELPELLPALPFSLLDWADDVNLSKKMNPVPYEKLPLPLPHRNRYSFSASVQGSISFVERKLSQNDSFPTGLLTLREKSENELEAVQVGLRLSLRHSSGFGLTSGLNYTQINERFRFNSSLTTVDTVYGVKYLVINLTNDTVPIYGDIPLTKKTTVRKEYYDRYRMIDIPVLVSYRYQGRGFAAGAEAGVFVNMSLSTEGRILQNDWETADIATAGIFKSNIGLSYYFGLSAGYLWNENLEFNISPFMRIFPKSFAVDGYELKQRYNLYGVNVGAVYHFR